MEDVLAITFIFGGGTLFLLAISPVGKAVAERIRRHGGAALPDDVRAELDALRSEVVGEVQQLRTEVSELSERMDFAERLLAKQRDAERLAPPGSRGCPGKRAPSSCSWPWGAASCCSTRWSGPWPSGCDPGPRRARRSCWACAKRWCRSCSRCGARSPS